MRRQSLFRGVLFLTAAWATTHAPAITYAHSGNAAEAAFPGGTASQTFAIHYVNAAAVGANNGTSWADAYTQLFAALAIAQPGDEIWVAAGTYKPTDGADRSVSFVLESGVQIYGGFNGTETLRSQRDWLANPTTLSGNIKTSAALDNTYHVISALGVDSTSVLDGFTISGGLADVTPFYGGGIRNEDGNPTFSNLTIQSNEALFSGGGMYNTNGNPELSNVTFKSNKSTFGSGGGMFNASGSPTLTNVSFLSNIAGSGSGMYTVSGSPKVTNAAFIANSNGGMYNENASTPVLTNLTVAGNLGGASGLRVAGTLTNSIVWGNNGGNLTAAPGATVSYTLTTSLPPGVDAGNNILGADPFFVDLLHGNARVFPGSPAIDSGNDAAVPPGVSTDLDGLPRFRGDAVDMGAYESCVGQWLESTPAVLEEAAANSQGVAWGDYDNDGLLDLYLTNDGTANKLLHNEGGGGFTDVTSPPLDDAGASRGAAWGDYNNDGLLDLYLANNGTANKLFQNNGGGSFTTVADDVIDDAGPGIAVAWYDYDNDGRLDLYLSNASPTPNKLFHNEGGGLFTDATSAPLADTGSSYGVAWGDYDDDGRADLFLANFGAPNKLLRNLGGGVFTDVTSGPLGGTGNSTGVAWGDYDNDGRLDLYVSAHGSGNQLLRNEGGGVFSDSTTAELADGDGQGPAWGDYDNDGWLDLYVSMGGVSNAVNKLFHNEGGGVFSDATLPTLADTSLSNGVAWADHDNDGSLDLYVANNGSANKLLRSVPGEAQCKLHWLQVKLVGVPGLIWPGIAGGSNVSAIGARVRVVAGGLLQVREISGGSGHLSQNSLAAEFGLWVNTTVETLEVRWPSGLVETWTDSSWFAPVIPIDTLITIVEGEIATDVAEEMQLPTMFRLYSNVPNPFNPATEIRYDLLQSAAVRLGVYDVAGRFVLTLVNSANQEAGWHRVSWFGRDHAGREVPSGIYFYRLDVGDFHDVRKMVLLR